MGEYATRLKHGCKGFKNEDYESWLKLGTCDDWRYVRRSEAERIAPGDAGRGTDLKAALAEPSILWRFPFPDEDGREITAANSSDNGSKYKAHSFFRGYALTVPPTVLEQFDHESFCVSCGDNGPGRGGGYNVNVFVPCPHLIKKGIPSIKMSTGGPCNVATIYGERYKDGRPRTIFRCLYCEAPFSVEQADIDAIAVINSREPSDANAKWWAALLGRLSARS